MPLVNEHWLTSVSGAILLSFALSSSTPSLPYVPSSIDRRDPRLDRVPSRLLSHQLSLPFYFLSSLVLSTRTPAVLAGFERGLGPTLGARRDVSYVLLMNESTVVARLREEGRAPTAASR